MIVINHANRKSQTLGILSKLYWPVVFPVSQNPGTFPLYLLIDTQNKIEEKSSCSSNSPLESNRMQNISFTQNGIEEENLPINSRPVSNIMQNAVIAQLTKDEYNKIVQTRRREFIHQHFSDTLREIFQKLGSEATKMKSCHLEAKFIVPDHFDVDKTEALLREYFRDIGYETIAEPRKDETTTIILTLT